MIFSHDHVYMPLFYSIYLSLYPYFQNTNINITGLFSSLCFYYQLLPSFQYSSGLSCFGEVEYRFCCPHFSYPIRPASWSDLEKLIHVCIACNGCTRSIPLWCFASSRPGASFVVIWNHSKRLNKHSWQFITINIYN